MLLCRSQMEYAMCVTVPFTNGSTDNYGQVQEERCTKAHKGESSRSLYHVAVDTFPFTSMAYIFFWIARCLTSCWLKN